MFPSLSIIIVLKLIVLILTAWCSDTATLNVKSIHILNCVQSEYETICRRNLSQPADSIGLLFVYPRYSLVSEEDCFNKCVANLCLLQKRVPMYMFVQGHLLSLTLYFPKYFRVRTHRNTPRPDKTEHTANPSQNDPTQAGEETRLDRHRICHHRRVLCETICNSRIIPLMKENHNSVLSHACTRMCFKIRIN